MKNLVGFVLCAFLSVSSFSQLATEFDEVMPYKEDLCAVKKGEMWGFINKKGDLVIDYRNDFVLTKNNKNQVFSPEFNNKRCLIKRRNNNIYYYGYIDNFGKEVIPPKYLNASNFANGYAIVVAHLKDSIGYNKVLKKALTSSKMEEYIIDISGETIKYLENPTNFIIQQKGFQNAPKLRSKIIAPNRVAVLKKNMKWDIYQF